MWAYYIVPVGDRFEVAHIRCSHIQKLRIYITDVWILLQHSLFIYFFCIRNKHNTHHNYRVIDATEIDNNRCGEAFVENNYYFWFH